MTGDCWQEGTYFCLIFLQKPQPHLWAITASHMCMLKRKATAVHTCRYIHTYILLLTHIERELHIIQEQDHDTHVEMLPLCIYAETLLLHIHGGILLLHMHTAKLLKCVHAGGLL